MPKNPSYIYDPQAHQVFRASHIDQHVMLGKHHYSQDKAEDLPKIFHFHL